MNALRNRTLALAGAAVLTLLSAAPATAADVVAQADASALTATIAGQTTVDTGTVTVTNDGSEETKSGQADPPLTVLGDQSLASVGVLAQDATTRIEDGDGLSAACAGVAGDGGSVVEIGDTGCLQPGQNVDLGLGSLDLTDLDLADVTGVLGDLDLSSLVEDGGLVDGVTGGATDDLPGGATDGLGDALDQVDGGADAVDDALDPATMPLDEVIDQIAAPLQQVIDTAEAQLGDLGLNASFGAIEAICAADPTTADGRAILTDADVSLAAGPAGEITLLDLPVQPAPNTRVVTDLGGVTDAVFAGLRTNLENALQGQAAQLATLTDAVQQQIVDAVVDQVQGQLAPLEDNVLEAVLNKQERSGGRIEVTALSLRVLPAAEAAGVSGGLASIDVATVGCGPNGTVAAPPAPAEPALPDIPTAVSAGDTAQAAPALGADSTVLWGGLVALAGAAGLAGVGVRSAARRR